MKLICGAVLLAFCASANAVDFTVGVNSTNYTTQGDGTWYQQGLPHALNLHTFGFTAGLAGAIIEREKWGIGWNVSYVHLGNVSSQCSCTPDDAHYNGATKQLIVTPGYNPPLANFVGHGSASGVALTLEPYYRMSNGWKLSALGGLFPYRPSWNETIYNWQVDPNVPPQTIHANTPHTLQLGWVAGAGIGHGPVTVYIKHYWLPTRFDTSHYPAIYKGAWTVEATWRGNIF